MAEYYVLIGDVVHSRDIEDREAFQEHLADICGRFTAERRDDVYGDFRILKGVDEFGGVLQSVENLYEVVTAFHDGLQPHEVRIVVAGGDIDVGLTSFDVERMDGEAFHRATRRVEELADESMVFDLLLGNDPDLGRAIADEINLLLDLRSEWTDRQREVVAVRESVETQTAAAEELGVTQQAVSNVLAGAKWPLLHAIEDRLRETLSSYARGREEAGDGRRAVERPPDGNRAATADRLDDVADAVPEPVRAAVEATLADDVPAARDEVDAFLDEVRAAVEPYSEGGSLHLGLARLLRDHGHPTEALDAYESVLDRDPADAAVYVEYATLAVEQDRHRDALARLPGLLEATAEAGAVGEFVDATSGRLGDVVEPVLANGGDEDAVRTVLDLLVSFAERTTDPAGEDVRRWSLVQHARLLGAESDRTASPDQVAPGWRVTDRYCTGLGFLLAAEPEAAASYFERACEERDETTLDDHERRLTDAAGVALLGCERVLGPAILDVPAGELRSEISDADGPLRAPAAWLLAQLSGDETTDDRVTDDGEDAAPVEEETDYEAFAELEARAFETLRDMIEQWADAT